MSALPDALTATFAACRLEAAPLKDAAGWVEQYKAFREGAFDRLDAYLRATDATAGASAPTRTPRGKPPRSKS